MKKLLSPVFRRLARAFGIGEIHSRLDHLEERLIAFEKGTKSLDQLATRRSEELVAARAAELWDRVVQRDDEIQESVMTATRLHTELVVSEVRIILEAEINLAKRGIDLVRSASSRVATSHDPEHVSPTNHMATDTIDESLYVALEDHFRGHPDVIRERQSAYIPYIQDCVNQDFPLLDLGCGRGEWLTLLRDEGIAAVGVDSNGACIGDCHALGLRVHHDDILSYLENLPDQSVGAVTMFQVLEHLPFPVLLDTLRAVLRVLKPGGVFIGEVPNSETLRVAATTFWIDPTHQRPLFPAMMQFLASEVGFTHVSGRYSTPLEPEPDVSSLSAEMQSAFLKVWHHINGHADFAIIATA